MAKEGHIYVLIHPTLNETYKVGVTTQPVKKRLYQHNTDFNKHAGKVVEETGQKWEIQSSYPVADIYHAENEFWSATGWGHVPFRKGIEIAKMSEQQLEDGIKAALKAGVRGRGVRRASQNGDRSVLIMSMAEYRANYGKGNVKPKKTIHNREWMDGILKGTGYKHVGEKFHHIQYTEFECPSGHVFKEVPRMLALDISCPYCTKSRPDYRKENPNG